MLRDHAHMWCPAVYFPPGVKKLSTLTLSISFEEYDSKEQERGKAIFDLKKQGLVFVKARWNFDWNPWWKSNRHVSMAELDVHILQ